MGTHGALTFVADGVEKTTSALVSDYVGGLTVMQVARKNRTRTSTVTAALEAAGIRRTARRSEYAETRRGLKHPGRWRQSAVCADLPETTWAYIAGIFDGEGALGCQRANPLSWRAQVNQLTESGLCLWLAETIGAGTCTLVKNTPANRRPMSVWRLHAQAEVLDFLLAVRPFLIVKRQKADAALMSLQPHFDASDTERQGM